MFLFLVLHDLNFIQKPVNRRFHKCYLLFKPYNRFNLKARFPLSDIVFICSCSLYLFFCLAPKRNNSLPTDKELFPPGQNTSSPGSNTSTPKQYSFTPGSNRFAPLTYSSAPGRHAAASRWQTSTSGRDALTPLRYCALLPGGKVSLQGVELSLLSYIVLLPGGNDPLRRVEQLLLLNIGSPAFISLCLHN